MSTLNLKANHKAVKDYYDVLSNLATLGASHEGVVSPAFAALQRSPSRLTGYLNYTIVYRSVFTHSLCPSVVKVMVPRFGRMMLPLFTSFEVR